MITERQQEQAALYVLGLLSADEQGRFAEQARANAQLRELLWFLQRAMERVVLDLPAQAPPPTLKAKVLQRIQAENTGTAPRQAPSDLNCCGSCNAPWNAWFWTCLRRRRLPPSRLRCCNAFRRRIRAPLPARRHPI